MVSFFSRVVLLTGLATCTSLVSLSWPLPGHRPGGGAPEAGEVPRSGSEYYSY